MNIVSTADEAFVPYFAALLHSAVPFHPNARFWLLSVNIPSHVEAQLLAYADKLGADLRILPAGPGLPEELYTGQGGARSMYARLLIPDLLPQGETRALYLDADISVAASLDELYNIDLQGQPLAAVADPLRRRDPERRFQNVSDDRPYINTGVLLMDLQVWRTEKLADMVFAASRGLGENRRYRDQSAINAALPGRFKRIAPRWNFLTMAERDGPITEAPFVVHHSGNKYDMMRESAFRELLFFHRSQTPWPEDVPTPNDADRRKRRKQRFLSLLGLKHYREISRRRRWREIDRERFGVPLLKAAQERAVEYQRAGSGMRI